MEWRVRLGSSIASSQPLFNSTFRRDFDALHDAGIPLVEASDGKRKRWQVAYKQALQRVSRLLDAGHYIALRLAVGQGGAVRNSPTVFATLEDLAEKIENALGERGRTQLAAIDGCFYSYEKHAYASAAPDILWPVIDAMVASETCVVEYRTPKRQGQNHTFEILPLRVFADDGAAYLMCYMIKHASCANLNMQRLVSL